MSKRITTQSEIKDPIVALDAFKAAGVRFRQLAADSYELQAGRSVGVLDLQTGTIVGDDMSFHRKDFDSLRMHYSEQKYLTELLRQGASIHSREVDQQGNIVITYQTSQTA